MTVKIAFLCGTNAWGGLEMNHLNNALYLRNEGFEVLVFCKKNSPIEIESLKNKIQIVNIQEHRRYKYFFAGLKFKKVLKTHKISHLFIRSPKDLNIASIAKTFSSKKFHLTYFMEMQLGVNKKDFLHTARFKKIDAWVCSTEFLKKQVLERTKFPINRIKIIPPALDLDYFAQDISQVQARKHLNLPQDKVILGLIGRIDPHKGQLLLLQALKLLANPTILVCFKGSPTLDEKSDYLSEIELFIHKNNLEKQVVFVPFEFENNYFYKALDFCIMASKSETFGMVSIEALASGTPLIASNAGGTTELLKNFSGTFPFESENAGSLAEAIDFQVKNGRKLKEEINFSQLENFAIHSVMEEIKKQIFLL